MKTGEEHEVSPKAPLALASSKPQWFPDNRSLLIHSRHGKLRKLDIRTGEYQPLPDSAETAAYDGASGNFYDPSVILAPDGRTIYYLARGPEAEMTRIMRRAVDGGAETELCRESRAGIRDLSISQDGERLVFLRSLQESGASRDKKLNWTWTVMTLPCSGGTPKEVYKSSEGIPWRSAMWSKDGRRLFFIQGILVRDLFTISAEGEKPQPLGIGLHDLYFLNLHPDGKQIVFADEQWNNQLWVLKNLFPNTKASR